MSWLESIHKKLIFGGRVAALVEGLSPLLPENASVLDVGCGDGLLARQLMDKRGDLSLQGIDVLLRKQTHIPVTLYDGDRFPLDDNSVDVVMFVDVLHHTDNPQALLAEANRVARKGVVIKDHLVSGAFAWQLLWLMDWVGNSHQGVALPCNYWEPSRWRQAFDQLDLEAVGWNTRLGLYRWPLNWIFERNLHFVCRLEADLSPKVAKV
ncbi:class I SAM-dependent methyltransferase [Aestuariirhabdus sp. LZHN29]|uniref:class I SAM-dependent methyltransferase n=1 Tax=Aestuariirhabdus sp. LZHN29 TaxID=3417462 RepID=UPI003CE98924